MNAIHFQFGDLFRLYLPEPHASLLAGIAFGQNIPPELSLYNQMKRIGLSHIAVFSGANISIVLGSISFIRAYIGNRLFGLIGILFILFSIIIVGAKAPIIRASLFSIFTFVALLTGRRFSGLYLSFISLILILSMKPYWIASVSLQLSYAATIGIMLFGMRLQDNEKSKHFVYSYIREELRISFAALFATLPIVIISFGQIPVMAPIANVLISFTITPLLLLGFLAGILGELHPSLAALPTYATYPILGYIIWVTDSISSLSFATIYIN